MPNSIFSICALQDETRRKMPDSNRDDSPRNVDILINSPIILVSSKFFGPRPKLDDYAVLYVVSNCFKNSRGMSLVEIVMAMGLLSMVTLGTSVIIQNNIKSQIKAENKKNLIGEISQIQNTLKFQTAATGSCKDIVKLAGSIFSNTQENPATLTLNNQVYTDGYIPTGSSFRTDRIYLSGAQIVTSTIFEKVYLATLYLEASIKSGSDWTALPRKPIHSLSLKISNSNALTDCNINSFAVDGETICRTISGMKWSPTTSACVQDIEQNADNSFTACPGGTQRNSNGLCVPVASGCYDQYLPQGFDRGIVDICNRVPAGYTVVSAPGYTPLPDPIQTPPSPTPTTPTSPTISGTNSCICGAYTIDPATNYYCVSCDKERNGQSALLGESYYYYSVEKCNSTGSLTPIIGSYSYNGQTGLFRDGNDPPSNGKCSRERSPGTYSAGASRPVTQLRYP